MLLVQAHVLIFVFDIQVYIDRNSYLGYLHIPRLPDTDCHYGT